MTENLRWAAAMLIAEIESELSTPYKRGLFMAYLVRSIAQDPAGLVKDWKLTVCGPDMQLTLTLQPDQWREA